MDIEIDDTVRFVGKRQHWEVIAIEGDKLWVWTQTRRGRDRRQYTRPVHRDRVELVRKGNKTDDIAKQLGIG